MSTLRVIGLPLTAAVSLTLTSLLSASILIEVLFISVPTISSVVEPCAIVIEVDISV